jgi:hypothetical protein
VIARARLRLGICDHIPRFPPYLVCSRSHRRLALSSFPRRQGIVSVSTIATSGRDWSLSVRPFLYAKLVDVYGGLRATCRLLSSTISRFELPIHNPCFQEDAQGSKTINRPKQPGAKNFGIFYQKARRHPLGFVRREREPDVYRFFYFHHKRLFPYKYR